MHWRDVKPVSKRADRRTVRRDIGDESQVGAVLSAERFERSICRVSYTLGKEKSTGR